MPPRLPSPVPRRRPRALQVHRLAAACLGLVLWAGPVGAGERSVLQHTVRDSAPAGQALVVGGTLSGEARFVRLYVRFRGPGRPYQEVPLERRAAEAFRGAIPASALAAPGVEYYVEGVTARGERIPVFRSADRPARVLVLREPGTASESTRAAESTPSTAGASVPDAGEPAPALAPAPAPAPAPKGNASPRSGGAR